MFDSAGQTHTLITHRHVQMKRIKANESHILSLTHTHTHTHTHTERESLTNWHERERQAYIGSVSDSSELTN